MDSRRSEAQSVHNSARLVALRILLSTEQAGVLTEETMERLIAKAGLDARDRGLAVHLVDGVERYRAALDWRLGAVSDRPVDRLPLIVQMVLRLGAYQMIHLSKIPDSAAVNESVRLIRAVGRKLDRDWSGFTNAVLRSLTRTPAPDWPDRAHDPIQPLAVRYSSPAWLVARWVERLGPMRAEDWCRHSLEPPPLTLRVNCLHITREAFLDQCRRAGYCAVPTEVSPEGLSVERHQLVTSLPLFHEGGFYVEDEAAQLVPLLLDPQPGERVLDACAAPGGKSTHLAALMKDQGEIIALDRSSSRLRLINDNCRRLGISIVKPVRCDLQGGDADALFAGGVLFDRILLDAPCSGLGVLRRHPEGKWHKQESSLAEHHRTQSMLLATVSRLLRPGGRLVYSTCSTEPEENEQVIERFCRAHHDFHREHVGSCLPPAGLPLITPQGDFSTMGNTFSMDGFYAACLRRNT